MILCLITGWLVTCFESVWSSYPEGSRYLWNFQPLKIVWSFEVLGINHLQMQCHIAEDWRHQWHCCKGLQTHPVMSFQLHQKNTLYINTYLYNTSPECFGVSHTNFRENFAFITQNHLHLQSYCLWYSGCVTESKTYSILTMVKIFVASYSVCYRP